MKESEKRDLFYNDMVFRGAKKSELRPPLFRLLWALGVSVPPPLFASGGLQFLVNGVLGGFFWGFFMWLTVWRDSPEMSILGVLLFGFPFALLMRFQLERRRKKLGLNGDWSDYQPIKLQQAEQVGDGDAEEAV